MHSNYVLTVGVDVGRVHNAIVSHYSQPERAVAASGGDADSEDADGSRRSVR